MIRAGAVKKIGCTKNITTRFSGLRPYLSIFGEPELIGYVEGTREDERYAHSLGVPFDGSTSRELFQAESLPDISEIFAGRTCYRLVLCKKEPNCRDTRPVYGPLNKRGRKPVTDENHGGAYRSVISLLDMDELLNYSQIAAWVGVSKERVRQIAKMFGETGR